MSSSPRKSAPDPPRREPPALPPREGLVLGAILAVLLLAALDAVPGPSLEESRIIADARGFDAVAVLLVVVLLYANVRRRASPLRTRSGRFLVAWAAAFIAWWTFVVVVTIVDEGIGTRHALVYGRDLLIFPAILPLLLEPMRDPWLVKGLLRVIVPAAALYSLLMALAIMAGGDPTGLLHVRLTNPDLGLTRIYVSVFDLVVAAVPVGIGFALFGTSSRARTLGGAVAALATLAVLLQLTRAVYLGLVVGLCAAGFVWLLAGGEVARRGRRRWLAAASAVGIAAMILILVNPGGPASTAVSGVAERVTTTFEETTSTYTVDYRQELASNMFAILGDEWAWGLGFLHPAERYFADLPSGDIRNPDVGVMNAIMTMGAVGALLIYLPLLYLLYRLLLVRYSRLEDPDAVPVAFSAFAWTVFALVSSLTLVVLFRQTGLTLTAFMCAWGLSTVPLRDPGQPASAAR